MSNNLELVKADMPSLQALISLRQPDKNAQTIARQEIEYLEMIALNKPDVYQCEPRSIVLAVKDVLNKNLSLNPSAGLVYCMIRSVKTGDKWVKVLELRESANGRLSLARQQGRIFDFTYPEIKTDSTGKVVGVSMSLLVPSYPAPRWQSFSFDESDFTRWRRASHKEFSRGKQDANNSTLNYANAGYTSWQGGIDPEFARAKCIIHSTKKLGTNIAENRGGLVSTSPMAPVIDPQVAAWAASDEVTYEDVTPVQTEEVKPTNNTFNADDL